MPNKKIILTSFLIVIFIGFFLAYVLSTNQSATVEIITSEKTVKIYAEIANSPEKWQRGLMSREKLSEYGGMLFIFPDEQPRSFWMKNTLIPLDIIFVASNFTIVDIRASFQPCKSDPCESYRSVPAKYVIEVNGGFIERNNIEVADKMAIAK